MAVSTLVDYTIRPSGVTTNGGGFKAGASGTDYSNQDAAQASYTTLAMANTGTTLTSTAEFGTVGSAIVGNIIYISGGTNFTTGWYEVTAYTDTNTISIDRNATNGSTASAGTGNMGGALHIDILGSTAFCNSTTALDFASGSHTIWIKTGTHTVTTAATVAFAGTTYTNKIPIIRGFDSTKGDVVEGTTRPLISVGTNAIYFNSNYGKMADLRWTGSATSGSHFRCGTDWVFQNCEFKTSATTGGASVCNTSAGCTFVGCLFMGAGTKNGIGPAGASGVYAYCYLENLTTALANGVMVNCIFNNCTTANNQTNTLVATINSTFYNCTTALDWDANTRQFAVNNIFHTCTTAIKNSSSFGQFHTYEPNIIWNNTTDYTSGTEDYILYTGPALNTWVNKDADPVFENVGSNDFTIQVDGPAANYGAKLPAGE